VANLNHGLWLFRSRSFHFYVSWAVVSIQSELQFQCRCRRACRLQIVSQVYALNLFAIAVFWMACTCLALTWCAAQLSGYNVIAELILHGLWFTLWSRHVMGYAYALCLYLMLILMLIPYARTLCLYLMLMPYVYALPYTYALCSYRTCVAYTFCIMPLIHLLHMSET
jgi:hypothetical protein